MKVYQVAACWWDGVHSDIVIHRYGPVLYNCGTDIWTDIVYLWHTGMDRYCITAVQMYGLISCTRGI